MDIIVACGSPSLNRDLNIRQQGRTLILRNFGGDATYLRKTIDPIIKTGSISPLRAFLHPNCMSTGVTLNAAMNPKGLSQRLQDRLVKDLSYFGGKIPTREEWEEHHASVQRKFVEDLVGNHGLKLRKASCQFVNMSRTPEQRLGDYTLIIGPPSRQKYTHVVSMAKSQHQFKLDLGLTFFLVGDIDDILPDIEISIAALKPKVMFAVEHSQADIIETYRTEIIGANILRGGSDIPKIILDDSPKLAARFLDPERQNQSDPLSAEYAKELFGETHSIKIASDMSGYSRGAIRRQWKKQGLQGKKHLSAEEATRLYTMNPLTEWIATEAGVSKGTVLRILKRLHLKPVRPENSNRKVKPEDVARLVKEGKTDAEIAKILNAGRSTIGRNRLELHLKAVRPENSNRVVKPEDVARLVREGKSDGEIAKILNVGRSTIGRNRHDLAKLKRES